MAIKLNLKEFDWKNFFLMRGEYVGLGVCLGITVLLTGLSLFMPKHGFFTGSGAENSEKLNSEIKKVEGQLASNRPREDDNPPKAGEIKVAREAFTDRDKYQPAPFFGGTGLQDNRRRVPESYQPDEGHVQIVWTQLKRYIFDRDHTQLQVLRDSGKASAAGASKDPGLGQAQRAFAGRGGAGRGGAGLGGGVRPIPSAPSAGQGVTASNKTELVAEFVPIDKLSGQTQSRLAETVLPLRMAVITASFPYRLQVEEFMSKLRLGDPASVLQESSEEKGPNGGQLPAFRFLGVRAERRIIDSQGKPIDALGNPTKWETLKLDETYKPYIFYTGKRFDPEDAQLEPIAFPGLFMQRLAQFRENQYPSEVDKVKNLKKTIESLKTKDPENIAKPADFLNVDDFNIFGAGGATTARVAKAGGGESEISGGGGKGQGARKPAVSPAPANAGIGKRVPRGGDGEDVGGDVTARSSVRGPAGPARSAGTATWNTDGSLPEHCLVRLLDVTIEPGKTYQYRIQVRMANPNYNRTDVASPVYAADKELTPDRWFELPDRVVVPPELLFYALDQKEVDGVKETRSANALFDKERQVAMQIHKWLESVDNTGNRPIGEWVAAERLLVNRGEYISRKLRCEVPEWKTTREEFILAAESASNASKKESGITVNFTQGGGNDAVVADFEGGDVSYRRAARNGDDNKATNVVTVKDKGSIEVLILSPEGKLLSRDSAVDAADAARKQRLEAYRNRIKDVKEGKEGKPGEPGKSPMGASPFKKT